MEPIKIGILGEIRAGKDTVAQLLEEHLVGNTSILAFSDGIHVVLQTTMPEIYADGKPRKQLQDVGQFFRSIKPAVWIEMLLNGHEYYLANYLGENILVTDVRQPNEAKRLKEEGFILLKVTADKEIREERSAKAGDNFTADLLNHETEIAVNSCEFDYEIDNSGEFDSLKRKVEEFLKYTENRRNLFDERETSEGDERTL